MCNLFPFGIVAFDQHFIDQTVLLGLRSGHPVVSICVLLDLFDIYTRMFGENFIELLFGAQNLFGRDLDVGSLTLNAAQRLVAMLPQEMRPAFATLLEESDPEVLVLVKAADKLSAHLKCLEELKAGNREFQSAAQQTRAALDAFHLPELDYFLAEFLPAFPLTLDELQADAQA